MEIFTKLLEINMVANSFLGVESNFAIIFPDGELPSLAVLTSVGESEKRATSEPEISAEQYRSIRNTTNCTIIEKSGTSNNKTTQPRVIEKIESKLRGGSKSKFV